MKHLLLLPLVLITLLAKGQTPQTVNSTIESVTVFTKGAQVERVATVTLSAGSNELIFNGLASKLDKNSIRLSSEQNLPILSLTHQPTNLAATKAGSEKLKTLTTKAQQVQAQIRTDRNLLKVYELEEAMLLKNQDVGGVQTGLKAADWKDATDFFRQRMQEVLTKQQAVQQSIATQEEALKTIQADLTQLDSPSGGNTSEINLSIQSPRNQIVTLRLTYFLENAGWNPVYDFRVKDIVSPVGLTAKAALYQFSGEAWNQVKLTLSNGNPRKRGVAPELRPWQWGIPNDYSDYYAATTIEADQEATITGRVFDAETRRPQAGVSVSVQGTPLNTVTDVNGFYRLTVPPSMLSQQVFVNFSFVGMHTHRQLFVGQPINVYLQPNREVLEEVVTTSAGIRRSAKGNMAAAPPPAMADAALAEAVVVNQLAMETDAPTSQEITLNERFTVPSDGKVYTAELKELLVPALYEYKTVPKVDTDVFLTAKLPNWEQYNLLPGDVNLFFEGTYLGKSTIGKRNTDTLAISLGRDKNVSVERNRVQTYQKKQFFSNAVVETVGYEIQVKNLKKQPITLIVEDQFPLSNSKQIEVSDKQAPGATEDPVTGKLTWKLTLQPNELRKLPLRYTIKYPKELSGAGQ